MHADAATAPAAGARLTQPAHVVCLNRMLDPAGEEMLRASGAEVEVVAWTDTHAVRAALPRADAIVVRLPAAFPADLVALAGRAKIVASSGSGTDHIDIPAATAARIPVVNNRYVGARAVAEHTLGLMLGLAKHIHRGDRLLRTQGWSVRETFHHENLADDLYEKTLCTVGFGPIARDIARICHTAFDMNVTVHCRTRPADLPAGYDWEPDLNALCARADFLSVNVPLGPATHHLVGREAISHLKPTAYVINTARGPVVDGDALCEALAEGRIAGAGLDVFEEEPLPKDHPLLGLPNVIVTPHVAGLSRSACRRLALSAAGQVVQVLKGERPPNLMNPEIWETRRT